MAIEREGKDIVLYGQSVQMSPLDREEQEVFEAQFDKLMGMNDSVERELLQDRKDVVLAGIKAIKYKMNGPRFTGWNPADNELGWSAIRPPHVRVNNLIITNWAQVFAVAGVWQRWLDGGAATTPYTAPYACGQIIVGMMSVPYLTSVQPLISAARWEIDRQVLVPFDLRPIALGDNARQVPIYPHPTVLILPRSSVICRTVAEIAGTDYVRPVGLSVGLGKFLKLELPVGADWTTF